MAGPAKLSIVIAEDDMFLQKILATKFAKEGFDVRTASDGEAALKAVTTAPPDILLLDLILPKLSGYEVLSEMKSDTKTKDVPVVVLSNLGQDEDKTRAKELGAVKFMIKSDFSINEVVATVKEVHAKQVQGKQ